MSTSWNEFLSVLAQVSVSMLALLFVSFQIARERWVSKATGRLVAVQTLLEFLVPSFFSIVALLPINPFNYQRIKFYHWQIAGILLCVCSLVVSVKILVYNHKHTSEIDEKFKNQVKLQSVTILVYFSIMRSLIAGNLIWVSILMILLLLSGSIETWLFFAELDEKLDSIKS